MGMELLPDEELQKQNKSGITKICTLYTSISVNTSENP